MFQRILVPLDGSARAERALSVAARMARASGGSIVLLRVVGLPTDYGMGMYGAYGAQPPVLTQDMLDTQKARAEAYLATIPPLEVLRGIKTEAKTIIGAPALVIEGLANEEQIDLIAMCSHGDTGFKRWVLGSVAQQVSRHSRVPVLVLHQAGTKPDTPFPDRLHPLRSILALVALDGSAFAEAAIEPTANLVSALASPIQGTLLLTRVLPLAEAGMTPVTKERMLDEAQAYLDDVAQAYAALAKESGILLRTSVAIGKDVAETLIRAAEQGEEAEGKRLTGNCDLIAMTTHGRGGLQRLSMGSVTEHVLGATKLSLLVVHSATTGGSNTAGRVFKQAHSEWHTVYS